MIILNVPKDKHIQVKKLGAVYNSNVPNIYEKPYDIKGCWCIDEKKDILPVLQWISPEDITFEALCKEIAQKEDKDSKVYSFVADVSKVFSSPNNAFYILTLNNSVKPNVDLKAKLKRKEYHPALVGKRVKVTGTIFWYAPFKTYQLKIIHLEVLEDTAKVSLSNPEEVDFDDIFNIVGQRLDIPSSGYIITADVHDVYVSKDGTSYIYTLYKNHNLRRTLRCKVTPALLNGIDYEELVDKNITVAGQIFLYKPALTFQLNAASVTINSPCTRIRELQQWSEQCKDLFHEEKYRNLKEVKKIGLIANGKSTGYVDFKSRLRALNPEDVIVKDIAMTLDETIKAIIALNKEDLDAICIIRGGSDPETLIDFSRPAFLHAIASSKIPVITGIGHANEELLCNKVAYYRAATPTDAADYINRQVYREKVALHSKPHKEQNEPTDWKKKCLEAEAKADMLENENLELTRQLEQLKRANSEKRSLFARIFHW